MNIKERSRKAMKFWNERFVLPIAIKNDCEYYSSLKSALDEYMKGMNNKENVTEDCKNRLRINCNNILKSVEEYYNANIEKALSLIYDIIEYYYDNSPFLVAEMKDNFAFKALASKNLRPSIKYKDNEFERLIARNNEKVCLYRARLSENQLMEKDMLHIPFNKRSIVSTQRFSIAGVPCLYLATTTFGAWIEMSMPSSDIFQVSEYEFIKPLKVLNLCHQDLKLSPSCPYVFYSQDITDFIETFPLVIATSFIVHEQNRSFKSEYIISQLIMQVARKLKIDGVAYLSKRMKDEYAYPCGVNLAILMPTQNPIGQNYWAGVKNIKLTKPVFFSDFLQKEEAINFEKSNSFTTYINKYYNEEPLNKIEIMGNKLKYQDLAFSRFDEYLHSQSKKILTLEDL